VFVKICGITREADLAAAIAAGADLAGFIFVPGTPRAVDAGAVDWVRRAKGIETVGVFRNAQLDVVLQTRDRLGLDWVQLHGAEPDRMVEAVGPRVIRRIPVQTAVDWSRIRTLSTICLPLFDPGGGDGVPWSWETLAEAPEGLRFGVAGGLNPDVVAEVVRTVHPSLVDVSSGVESVPGIKDHDLIRRFVAEARKAADNQAVDPAEENRRSRR
jgi:phosphoribosylanthranilate isomerase